MKRQVCFVVIAWVEIDRCYADPHGRTQHEQVLARCENLDDAAKCYARLKKHRTWDPEWGPDRSFAGRPVKNARIEKRTVEVLAKFDVFELDQAKRRKKKVKR